MPAAGLTTGMPPGGDRRRAGCGRSAAVTIARTPRTRVIDAGGRFITPGFIDDHTHFAQAGALPDVPSMKEQGYPGLVFSSWFGIVAPAKTPADVVALNLYPPSGEVGGQRGRRALRCAVRDPREDSPRRP